MKSRKLTDEEAKKYGSSRDDYKSEFLKHCVRVEKKPNPIQDFLDSQKNNNNS